MNVTSLVQSVLEKLLALCVKTENWSMICFGRALTFNP